MNTILIFTDGSSRGNPGPGGFGAIIATADHVVELGGRDEHTTNNKMELMAAIRALEEAGSRSDSIEVYSDSKYVIQGITSWIFGWLKNNWMNSQQKPVENRDLWERLHKVTQGKKIKWNYVAGHAGHDANERCDEIATSFADDDPTLLYNGPRAGYTISLAPPSGGGEASGKPFYISFVEGVLEEHETWAECEDRVKGKAGAKFKKVKSHAEAKRVLEGWK